MEYREKLCAKQREISELKANISDLEFKITSLAMKSDEIIPSKTDGKTFSPQIRLACYALQHYGVSQANTSSALEAVHKALKGEDISGSLPSYATQNQFIKEMKSLSLQHVKSKLQGAEDTTVSYDGSTKTLGHLAEVEVSSPKGTLLLGLRQQCGGKGEEYFQTIKESFQQVEDTSTTNVKNTEARRLMDCVANTMSDRCTTNNVIDEKLEEAIGRPLNRFKCAMHPLDSIAKAVDKSVKLFEDRRLTSLKKRGSLPFIHRGESQNQALIRTTSKIFHSTKYSCREEMTQHLRSCGLVAANASPNYHRFVGNRFHVMFLDSATLFAYSTSIVDFFTSTYSPKNAVQSAILNALKLEDMMITLRAVGIIGKVITGP